MKLKTAKTRGRTLDHAASVYDLLAPIMSLGKEKVYFNAVINEMKVSSSDKIIDIGCGTGKLQRMLTKMLKASDGGYALGIDAASKMIEKAHQKNGNDIARFEVAAAEKLPYEDLSFDKACSLLFFHHIDYELKVKAVSEIKRVLKPDGIFVVIDVDKPSNWWGEICIRCGELLFRQPEIGENRKGLLPQAFVDGGFSNAKKIAHWQGHVSMYKMKKLLPSN